MKNCAGPTKFSVAVFLTNPKNQDEFLIVQRPPDDDKLPNVWGLPAVTLADDESLHDAVMRVGMEKLDTEIELVNNLGTKSADRGEYLLTLTDVKAQLMGAEPSVGNAKTTNTKYVDQKWTSDLNMLREAASKGSLCSQIILDLNSIEY